LRETLGRESHYEVIRSTTTPILVMGTFEDEMRTYQLPVESGREELMRRITERCDAKARELGIKVTDVRVKRVDFQEENATSVYQRMTAERERIATRHLNEGIREAEIIRSGTDRRVKILLAEAEKTNLEVRGKADAEAARIYAEGFTETLPDGTTQRVNGFGDDPEFFEFVRKLEALKRSVNVGERLILSTESPLFQVFNPEEIEAANPME
jgi:membrane protease subunit HflC